MKPPLIQRLKARLLVSGHKNQQGVAILTVLAIITLMTVLVISFFNMAQTAQSTAKGSVEIQRVTTLKDTVINLVIAQFREASRLAPTSAGKPREIITWTSGPGGIRTYSGTDTTKNRFYKLYSSKEPQLGDLRAGETSTFLSKINEDNQPDWAERPDEFTDINRPVYTSATGDRATATGATDREGYSYPVADPRAYNGNDDDPLVNVEGFRYDRRSLQKTMRGVDPRNAQLAMPLRWIYQLQDGTLGYLSESKEFTPLNGQGSGEVSRLNPIVGRMAWWADDETCKINVNTASVPAIWDTPRTTSKEDVWLANTQPLAGEYQRYPGHPATVDVSAVFYPGRRYAATDGSWQMSIGKSMKMALTDEEANLIWDLAPFIVGTSSSGEIGTNGGKRPTPKGGTTVGFEGDDHLFTSLDEMYFKASAGSNPSLNSPRENLESQKRDVRGELLQRLERAQFFLTHKSHSPELTNQGFPRISMFPMDTNAAPYVGTTSTANPPNTVSPYDITMAVNSTIGKRPYYLQRRDPNSRHGEFYSTSGATDPGRNANLFKYLKELSKLPIPGYPSGYAGAQPFRLSNPTLTEDPDGLSLASKYPAGYNPTTQRRYTDSGINSQNGQTLMDASDRTQILLNMLDFTRSLNMQPAFIATGERYDDGFGQATGICGCGNDWGNNHGAAMLYSNQAYRTPKGAGKLLVPSEIAMVVNVAARKDGQTVVAGDWNALVTLMATNSQSRQVAADNDSPGTRFIVEVGFIMSAFSPKMGWAPVQPRVAMSISSPVTSATAPQSPAGNDSAATTNSGDYLPFFITLDGSRQERLRVCGTRNASSGGNTTPRRSATNLIPFGGQQGPRDAVATGGEPNGYNVAICSPICIRVPEASDRVKVDLQTDNLAVLRILLMDGVIDDSNVTNSIDLRLPTDFASGLVLPLTGITLSKQALKWSAGTSPFPDGQCAIRSMVIPHGDYRLASSIRMDSDMYVAHDGYRTGLNAHSFYESNIKPAARRLANSTFQAEALMGIKAVPHYSKIGGAQPITGLPLPKTDFQDMDMKGGNATKAGNLLIGPPNNPKVQEVIADKDVYEDSSSITAREPIFAFGRRDGRGLLAKRGSSDPQDTGDFDTGTGAAEDGPYMNYPDEGDRRTNPGTRYFNSLEKPLKSSDEKTAQNISPNFLVRSPVDFGSIPTGLQARVPWQTLRFRPDPRMNDTTLTMTDVNRDKPPIGMPFANYCGPRDHFFLDMFWMPVVEPYSISEPFSTKGTINLNQQIFPFLYIERTTALHALLRGERIMAIPNDAAQNYKRVDAAGNPDNDDPSYRYFLNVNETVKQFTQRYNEGTDPEGFNLAFNSFRSASEICEVWLVPDKNGGRYEGDRNWDLAWTIGTIPTRKDALAEGFWPEHRLTGDNARERPYANLYPRVTVRSNVFKLHIVAQTLQKARSTDPKTFNSLEDLVTAEWRGSCLIERSADSQDAALRNIDYTNLNAQTIDPNRVPRIDRFYTYRVTEVKQLTQ